MNSKWIERYVEAIKVHLPTEKREDVGAEIASLMADKIEALEVEKGRALTEQEELALIEEHGHPLNVATAYRPTRALVPEAVFPEYLKALKLSMGIVLVVMAGLMLLNLGTSLETLTFQRLTRDALHFGIELADTALLVFALVTLVFSGSASWTEGLKGSGRWRPARLLRQVRPGGYAPVAGTIADMVLVVLFLAVVNGILKLPAVMDHKGLEFTWRMSEAARATVPWFNALMAGWMLLYLANLMRPYWSPLKLAVEIGLNLLFIAVLVKLFFTSPLISVTSAGISESAPIWLRDTNLRRAIRASTVVLILISARYALSAIWRWRRVR